MIKLLQGSIRMDAGVCMLPHLLLWKTAERRNLLRYRQPDQYSQQVYNIWGWSRPDNAHLHGDVSLADLPTVKLAQLARKGALER